MSLSSLLETDKELRAYLRQLVEKPRLASSQTPNLLAPPRSTNFALVGTAFDYLLRWRLQYQNRLPSVRGWVAENALSLLPPGRRNDGARLLARAVDCHARYLADGALTHDLI